MEKKLTGDHTKAHRILKGKKKDTPYRVIGAHVKYKNKGHELKPWKGHPLKEFRKKSFTHRIATIENKPPNAAFGTTDINFKKATGTWRTELLCREDQPFGKWAL